MATEQPQVSFQQVSQYKPLNDNDTLVYEQVDETYNIDSFSLILFFSIKIVSIRKFMKHFHQFHRILI
jgi:hypothetical protein